MRTSISWLWAALAAGVLASCAGGGSGDIGGGDPAEGGISEVPNPNPAMAASSGKPLATLQRGHEVYMLKCAECHSYKLPANIDIPSWQAGALRTECGADLSGGDTRAVVDYVAAVKAR